MTSTQLGKTHGGASDFTRHAAGETLAITTRVTLTVTLS